MPDKPKTIVVLGSHRSGSSLLAGILQKLGIDMGRNLIGKAYDNPSGHFEDISFTKLNERILSSAGGRWNSPPPRAKIEEQKTKFSDSIKKLVSRKNQQLLFGWKDPRTSLLISLYEPYLENPYYVVCDRNLEEILNSLARREGRPKREIKKYVLRYLRDIDEFVSKQPKKKVLRIKYDNLVKNPKGNVDLIIRFLSLKPSKRRYNDALRLVKSRRELFFAKKLYLIRAIFTKPRMVLGEIIKRWILRPLNLIRD